MQRVAGLWRPDFRRHWSWMRESVPSGARTAGGDYSGRASQRRSLVSGARLSANGTTGTAAPAGAAFSPGDEKFCLPAHAESDRFRKALAELGSDSEFRDGVAALESVGIRTSFKTIERVAEHIGAEVAEAQHGAFARAAAPQEAPTNPAELLVVEGDGLRVRELVDDATPEPAHPQQTQSASDCEISEKDRCAGWGECKVGVVVRMRPGRTTRSGEYEPPTPLLQTYVATMGDIRIFGEKLLAEAERKGLRNAKTVIALSDAGHGLPNMWTERFGNALVAWIIDFHHVSSRLSECASVVSTPGAAATKRYGRWKGLLRNGQVGKILKELVAHAREHAARPDRPSDLPEDSPGRILWTHVFYIEKYRQHMDYPTYRANGWPIASGHVEAFAKRVGVRMKAANKRWKPVVGSEAMANLIADRASDDGRWDRRWPAPVYPAAQLQLS